MGQRLVVNVIENGKRICAIYYHWSAYSSSAYQEAADLLKIINDGKLKEKYKDVRLRIIRGVEAGMTNRMFGKNELINENKKITDFWRGIINETGLLDKDDMDAARNAWPGEDFAVPEHASRSHGIVAIRERTMENYEAWAEGTLDLDLTNGRIRNFCFWDDDPEEWVDEMRENGDISENEDWTKIVDAMPKCADDPCDIAFADLDKMVAFIQKLAKDGNWEFTHDGRVYSIIG